MADFSFLIWRNKTESDLAQDIARDVRRTRTERGRAGHRLNINTVKSIWSADDIHVVLNHRDDPVWQYWYSGPLGWELIHWYGTRREAQAAAENPHPDRKEPTFVAQPTSGIFVYARWTADSNDSMKIHCTSHSTADDIVHVLSTLGCKVRKDLVVASLLDGSSR